MRKIKTLFALVCFVLSIFTTDAQDANFMMYSNTSLNINPAIISSSDYFAINVNYNNKSYINDLDARSAYLMLSKPLYKKNERFGGFGFSILSEKGGGNQQLTFEGITGAYAHEVQLTSWSRLSLGLQASYMQKSIESRNYTTGSQWVDGVGYDPTAGNGEQFESLSTGNFTLSSGLFWYIPNSDRTIKYYLGFALYNLTKPRYSFFGVEHVEPFKYIISTAYQAYSKGRYIIKPQALYYNSYYENHYVVGAKWTYLFDVKENSKMFSSGSIDLITDYQLNDVIAIGLQLNQPSFSIGIGYGFPDKFSNSYTPEKSTIEVSFSYKRALFKNPAKQKVEPYANYHRNEIREFSFEDENVVLKEKVKEVEKELKRENDEEIKFKLEKDFQFGFNDAGLNEDAKKYINDIMVLLTNNKVLNVEIIGHTDNVGTKTANQVISDKRANVVRDYLIEKGIAPERITTRGMADSQPLFDNNNKENRSKNRRVEFVIFY